MLDKQEKLLGLLSEYTSDFLGFFNNLKFDNSENYLILYNEFQRFKQPYVNELYEPVFKQISNYFRLKENILAVSGVTLDLINNFVNDIAMSLLFDNYYDKSDGDKLKIQDFIKALQDLSVKTYESEAIKFGILYCENDDQLSEVKNNITKFGTFIDMKHSDIKSFILQQKPLLKLIDNKSFALVLDYNFAVIGIIRKNKNDKSIEQHFENIYEKKEIEEFFRCIIKEMDYMNKVAYSGSFLEKFKKYAVEEERIAIDKLNESHKRTLNSLYDNLAEEISRMLDKNLNKLQSNINKKYNMNFINNMPYIYIKNREINFLFNKNHMLTLNNNKWKYKCYLSFIHDIFAAIYEHPNYELLPFIDKWQKNILKNKKITKKDIDTIELDICKVIYKYEQITYCIIKLVKVIKHLSANGKGALFVILSKDTNYDEIYDELLIKNNNYNDYKMLVKTKDGKNVNISELDEYLLELIASVDGAIILNSNFEIISFSEMINTQNFNKESCGTIYGSRTNAAVNAAKYGIAIKVSEDGDISMFRKVKYRDKEKKVIERIEKVLTI